MAMYFSLYWHFIIMVLLVMIFSGVMAFRFPRFPFSIVLMASGIIGYIYGVMTNLDEIAFIFIVINVFYSIVPIVLIEWAMYMRHKADEWEMQKSLLPK
ncbi:hypothetical protein [Lysinibacillus sp. 54212]|uniref:hypothetical protein n=1 Tax=Lysinibacillus sp. 54212 TaxID=3119829 RepID=UPI002FC7FBFB